MSGVLFLQWHCHIGMLAALTTKWSEKNINQLVKKPWFGY